MPVVDDVFYDGDFSVATQVGAAIPEIPFVADPVAYLYYVTYWQLKSNYAPLAKDTPGPYGGFATGIDKNFRDEGGGVLSFRREFAYVPNTRNEYESFVYPFQVWATGSAGGIAEFPFSVNSRIQYDYFQTTDPTTIALSRAPRIIDAFNHLFFLNSFDGGGGPPGPPTWSVELSAPGTGYIVGQTFSFSDSCISFSVTVRSVGIGGSVLSFTVGGVTVCNPASISNPYSFSGGAAFNLLALPSGGDEERLAEDNSLRVWKGNIFERKSRYVVVPSIYSFLTGH